jgi:hypothetical protein
LQIHVKGGSGTPPRLVAAAGSAGGPGGGGAEALPYVVSASHLGASPPSLQMTALIVDLVVLGDGPAHPFLNPSALTFGPLRPGCPSGLPRHRRPLSSNPVYYVAMNVVDIAAWAFLSLLIGWIGFMLWSTYVWLREGFEHVSGRGQGFPPRGGDPW